MTKSALKLFYKENKTKYPLIIFIHGAACDHSIWCFQNRYFFNRGYSVLTLDLPGHGENNSNACSSIKEMSVLVKALIGKLNKKEIILVGHSMGGWLAQIYAALFPDKVHDDDDNEDDDQYRHQQ